MLTLFNETTDTLTGAVTTRWEITREDGMMVAWLSKSRRPFAKWIVSKKGLYETFTSKEAALRFARTVAA